MTTTTAQVVPVTKTIWNKKIWSLFKSDENRSGTLIFIPDTENNLLGKDFSKRMSPEELLSTMQRRHDED